MQRIKLTANVVNNRLTAPHPSGKQVVVRDAEMIGFGVLLSGRTNVKSWIVERRGCPRRVIERTDLMAIDAARGIAADWLKLMRGGDDPKAVARVQRQQHAAKQVTLRAALAEYLETKTTKHGKLREVSKKYYRSIIECHLRDWLDLPIRSLTVEQLQQRHAHIFKKNGGSIAGMTMKVLRAVLHHNGVPKSFVSDALAGRWAHEEPRTGHVADHELPAFWGAVQGLDNTLNRTAVTLMLFVGLRAGEALGLRWSEVDIEAGTITLPPHRNKSGRQFLVPLSAVPLEALKGLRKLGRDRAGFVFPSSRSRTGHLGSLEHEFTHLGTAIGHPITRHDLRRTFATLCHESGAGEMDTKRLMNHALDKKNVTGSYVQKRLPHLRQVQDKVGAYILARCLGQAPEPDEVETLRAQVAELQAALAQRGRARAA